MLRNNIPSMLIFSKMFWVSADKNQYKVWTSQFNSSGRSIIVKGESLPSPSDVYVDIENNK